MVVFATPGMLHAGLSLQIFKKWAEDEKNMVRSVAKRGLREWLVVQYNNIVILNRYNLQFNSESCVST